MTEHSRYASELNKIQDTVLEAISTCRDEIETVFDAHFDADRLVDQTLSRLFAYQSGRSQAISYLTSGNFVWDAEIVMRSFYEAHAKIWFICQSRESDREPLAREFWGDYRAMHDYKRAKRVKPGIELFAQNSRHFDAAVYEALADEEIFDFHGGIKAERKRLAQKWSFSEIIDQLEKRSDKSFPLRGVSALKHMYGMQSHLIHADEAALDLMLDRRLRSAEELEILASAHVCRIFSDQASLWNFSVEALRFRYGLNKEESSKRWSLWRKLHQLTKPFQQRFSDSQHETYDTASTTKSR